MNHFFPLLTGDRPADLERHTARSSKKVTAIGMSLLLVTGIWAGIGYLLGHVVVGLGTTASLCMAGAMGAIIFVVDRSIILIGSKAWHAWVLRGLLATLGAYLGTIGMDQALFDADIQQVVAGMRAERVLERERSIMAQHAGQEDFLRGQLATATAAYEEALTILNAELDGGGRSSGYRGYGAVARQKAKAVEQLQERMTHAQADLNTFMRERDEQVRAAGQAAQADFQDGALLERMVALNTFLARNPVAKWKVILPLFIFMLLVELTPLYLKLGTETTAYEEELAIAETIRRERARTIHREQQAWAERQRGLSVEARQAERYLTSLHQAPSALHTAHRRERPAA